MTPYITACQASLSCTISWSLLKLVSIELVVLSKHPILCCPLLRLPSVFPSIRVFSNGQLYMCNEYTYTHEYMCVCLCAQLLSLLWLFASPWTIAARFLCGDFPGKCPDWVAISSSRGSSWPRDWTHISCIGRRILYYRATQGAWIYAYMHSYTQTHTTYIHTTHMQTHTYTHTHIYIYLIFTMIMAGGRRSSCPPLGEACTGGTISSLSEFLEPLRLLHAWQFVPKFPSPASFSELLTASVLNKKNSSHIVFLEDMNIYCILLIISTSIKLDLYFPLRNWLWPPTSIDAVKLLSWQLAKLAFYGQNPFHTFFFIIKCNILRCNTTCHTAWRVLSSMVFFPSQYLFSVTFSGFGSTWD